MMRQMRENTKWIMLVTAIAFVALMVFEWGMDITGQTATGLGEIGRVNGTPVSYEQYEGARRYLYEQVASSQEGPVTPVQSREIEEAAWTEVVNQLLIQQELERRGVRVTDSEIQQQASVNPPPDLRQWPVFQTDGQFDIQKYRSYLSTSATQLDLLQLEAYYREIIPRGKLLRQVTSGIFFTDAELWEQYKFETERVRVRFVAMNPVDRIADLSVQVTDAEIQDYYDSNREGFQIPAEVEVRYVTLTKSPLREDTLEVLRRAEEVRQEILSGIDFAEVALRESSDEVSAANGGDLGTFARGSMVPAFDSVVFSAPLNRLSEPVQTSVGFHIIEVLSRRGDSAQARHILLPIERTNDSEMRLLSLADTLEILGESMTLDDAAAAVSVPVAQQVMSEAFPFLAGVGQVADGLDWAFLESAPGDVSPVFEDQQAFYMMELISETPEGIQPLEDARAPIEQLLRREKKVELARQEAIDLGGEARTAGSLEVLAGRDNLMVQEAGPNARPEFFPGLGYQNKAVGAAFGLEVGQIGEPVVTETNVYLIQALEKFPADSAAFEESKADLRAQSVFTVQQQRLEQWIQGMRDAADIQDRREEVFRGPQG